MDATTLKAYADRLRSTGLVFARYEFNGSNIVGLDEVPWEQVLLRFMRDTQLVMMDKDTAPEKEPRQYGHLTRIK